MGTFTSSALCENKACNKQVYNPPPHYPYLDLVFKLFERSSSVIVFLLFRRDELKNKNKNNLVLRVPMFSLYLVDGP